MIVLLSEISKILPVLLIKSALLLIGEKKAEKFLLICCVGVMMFDFYYSVRRIVKSYSYQYNSSKKERDIMKAEKYHIYLSEQERSQVIQVLIELKNDLIAQGRYTDAVDDVLIKFTKARKKKMTVQYI